MHTNIPTDEGNRAATSYRALTNLKYSKHNTDMQTRSPHWAFGHGNQKQCPWIWRRVLSRDQGSTNGEHNGPILQWNLHGRAWKKDSYNLAKTISKSGYATLMTSLWLGKRNGQTLKPWSKTATNYTQPGNLLSGHDHIQRLKLPKTDKH